MSNPPPILLAAAALEVGGNWPDTAVICRCRARGFAAARCTHTPSVPVSDSSDDTGEGALMRELLLGMVPKVA